MGNMYEMKIDPALLAGNKDARMVAKSFGNKLELGGDIQKEVPEKVKAGNIDTEKRKRATEYATAIADLEAELERAKAAAGKAGDMAHNFDKLISSIKSEIAAKEIEFAGEAGTDIAN